MLLFSVNDAGPARYLAYILKELEKREIHFRCVVSKVSKKVMDEFEIENSESLSEINFNEVHLVITGTTLIESIDREAIRLAKSHNVKSISVNENWSHYYERFNEGYPDIIFVNDEAAYQHSVSAGLPKEILQIVGNPVLEYNRFRNYSEGERRKWKEKITKPKLPRTLLFISEAYRDDIKNGIMPPQPFDEYTILEDIIDILPKDYLLLIKQHPCEEVTKYQSYLSQNVNLYTDDLADAIGSSDFIIGLGSMLLIESALARGKVYSYRPNENGRFIGDEVGLTTRIASKSELIDTLSRDTTYEKVTHENKFKNSTNGIADLLQGLKQ